MSTPSPTHARAALRETADNFLELIKSLSRLRVNDHGLYLVALHDVLQRIRLIAQHESELYHKDQVERSKP